MQFAIFANIQSPILMRKTFLGVKLKTLREQRGLTQVAEPYAAR